MTAQSVILPLPSDHARFIVLRLKDLSIDELKEKLEDLLYQLKKLCWNQSKNASYGVNYSDYSDMLIDMYEVIRHELWKEDDKRLNYTVDAYPAHHWNGNEPLIKVEKL